MKKDWISRYVTTKDGVFYNGYIYVSASNWNGLYRLDTNSNKADFMGIFPEEEELVPRMHRKCILYNDTIIFLPENANNIHFYDLKSCTFNIIPFDMPVKDACINNNRIWLIAGNGGEHLFGIDIDSCSIYEEMQFNRGFAKKRVRDSSFLATRCSFGDGKIWIGIFGSKNYASYDVQTKNVEIFETEIHNIFSAHYVDEKIWILQRYGKEIYSYDINRVKSEYMVKKVINSVADMEIKSHRYYNDVIQFCDSVVFLPAQANEIIFIKNGSMERLSISKNINEMNVNRYCFGGVIAGEYLCILPYEGSQTLFVNNNYELLEKSYRISDKEYLRLVKSYAKKNELEYYKEDDDMSLDDFIVMLGAV